MSDWPGYEGDGCCPVPPYPCGVPFQGPNLQGVDASLALVAPSDTGVSTPLSTAIGGRVQRSGDTMTGRLLLGMGNPVSSLEAACKQYVDTQILLGLSGQQTNGTFDLIFTDAGTSVAPITPMLISFAPVADRGAGGYSALSTAVLGATVSQNPDNSGSRFDSEIVSAQMTVQSTANGNVGHVTLGSHATKTLPKLAAGTAYTMTSSDVLPAIWALYGTVEDNSQLISSIGGPMASAEYDMFINAADDQGVRGGFTNNIDCSIQVSGGGLPGTIAQSFYSYGLGDAWAFAAFRAGGNHIMAGLDCRPVSSGNTTVSVPSSGTTVQVTNVTPFLIGSNFYGIGGAYAVSKGSSDPVKNVTIGANVYTVNTATSDGPGKRSGTLTLSSALQGTDGAVGTAVSRPFYGLILATGQNIAFDYDGNVRMFYDAAALSGAGAVHLKCNFLSDGEIYAGNISSSGNIETSAAVVASGSAASLFSYLTVLGTLTANDGLNVSSGFFNFSVFYAGTVPTGGAAIPAAGYCPTGGAIWVADGLKNGETAGAGSGVIAVPNAARNGWLRASDYSALAH